MSKREFIEHLVISFFVVVTCVNPVSYTHLCAIFFLVPSAL